MTIKQLPEVVNGRVKASVEKVDASLIDLAPTGNALVATTEGLKVDLSSYATTTDVSNAIAAAQLANGEVNLSGYATKADLEDYSRFEDVSTALFGMESVLNARVANLVSTTALEEAIEEVNTSIPSLIDTKIATLVDGAPSTFDTLKEIADWIETDGVTATELASSVAGKADRTEFTTLETSLEGVRTELLGEVTSKLDTPLPTPVANTTPALENSLPLYTLKNNGEYVLCTPDTWFLINGFYVPGYAPATLGL